MAFSLYEISVPPMAHTLTNLKAILAKGDAHGGIDPEQARLAADMLPLKNQVYIAADTAKGCGARLGGVEIPKFEDVEVSFADLQARIAKTIDFLKGIDKAGFAGAEDKEIILKFPSREMKFTGIDYLNHFVLPNFYFHVTTAYDILRNKGVAIGKSDFLGG